jgi:hypothetical protein
VLRPAGLEEDEGTEGDQAEEQYHYQNDHQQERVTAHFAHSLFAPGES